MIKLDFTAAARAFSSVITKVNELPSLVKGIAALALFVFTARVVWQAGSALYCRTWKRVPSPERSIPSPNAKVEENVKTGNLSSSPIKEILHRIRSANNTQTLMHEAPALLANLEKEKSEDFLPDELLLGLIPLIEQALKQPILFSPNSNAALTNLIILTIRRKKVFPAEALNFLLRLICLSPEYYRKFVYEAVKEGRVFSPHKDAEAICLFLKKLHKIEGETQFLRFIFSFSPSKETRVKILQKAFSEEPLSENEEDIIYAKIAFYLDDPFLAPNEEREKWETARQKLSAILLKTSPGYLVKVILERPHNRLMPILADALLKCTEQEFLESFSQLKDSNLPKDPLDQILNRLFSIKVWPVADLKHILIFLRRARMGQLSSSEITSILKRVNVNSPPEHLANAYAELASFVDAAVFLNHLPLRENLKPFIPRILVAFQEWPELKLSKMQQTYYCPADPGGDQLLRSLYARFFPNAFTQIRLAESPPWLSDEFEGIKKFNTIINSIDTAENLVFLRKHGKEFLKWANDVWIGYDSIDPYNFARLGLQIVLRMSKNCPHNEKLWSKDPQLQKFFLRLWSGIVTASLHIKVAYSKHPSVLSILGDLAKSAPQIKFSQFFTSWSELNQFRGPSNSKEAAQTLNDLAHIAKAIANDDEFANWMGDRFRTGNLEELCKFSFVSLEEVALALEAKQIFKELNGITLPVKFDRPLAKKLMRRQTGVKTLYPPGTINPS